MKSLNSSAVDASGADAGVGSGPSVGSEPSIGARDPRVNELDKLAPLGILSVRGAGGSVWRGFCGIAAAR